MKENARKILLWLYSDDLRQPFVSNYEQLQAVIPELSSAGMRSMVRYLSTQQLVRTETVNNRTLVSITRHGADRLKQEFPAFSYSPEQWKGKWSALVFLHAPPTDKGFRYLRTVLLEENSLAISRGTYVYPGEFPAKIMHLCQELYVGAVVIFSIAEWRFGDERSMMVDSFSLSAVAEMYSGVSNETNRLLQVRNQQKGSYQTLKKEISSVFNRLFSALSQDTGLTQYYFRDGKKPTNILLQLHQAYP
jgi:DNA-binding transcriptional regulator PaaX